LSLTAANCLLDGIGIGARPREDMASRMAAMQAFGLDDARSDQWLQEDFIAGLMNSDTYQLCANL
jgi:hypothetical protein